MKIAGIINNSFVDYPGMIAAVVFTYGCNFRCHWCHNHDIIKDSGKRVYSDKLFLLNISKKRDFLDAVVISGGEPTLQPKLFEFAAQVKELGYLLKLDTNGSRPQILSEMICRGLVDYVAMDIKAPIERYDELCGCCVDIDAIKRSVDILRNSGVKHEFRTTFVPVMTPVDIERIAEFISGAERYFIQQFRKTDLFTKPPHDQNTIENARQLAQKNIKNCEIR